MPMPFVHLRERTSVSMVSGRRKGGEKADAQLPSLLAVLVGVVVGVELFVHRFHCDFAQEEQAGVIAQAEGVQSVQRNSGGYGEWTHYEWQ